MKLSREVDGVRVQAGPKYDLSIVGVVGLPASYGGFETLAERLVLQLARRYRIQVFCTTKKRPDRRSQFGGADLRYIRLDANGWQSCLYDVFSLLRAARSSRALLVLGIPGCSFLPIIRLIAPSVRIVAHIDGLEWRRRKWGTIPRAILRLSKWFAITFSHAVIADNQAIREHVQRSYRITPHLIAYGGDTVRDDVALHEGSEETRFPLGTYFLTICRVEPENNVAEILAGFQSTAAQSLVVVGNWNASAFARGVRRRYALRPNIELLDPIYDRARLTKLRRGARAYVHGHAVGGTNPSLVEAMAAGLAVLAFDVSYNRNTTNGEALYWTSSADLARIVATVTERELAENARRMYEYARREYVWEKVAAQYVAVLFP